jgi:hypothetical protein
VQNVSRVVGTISDRASFYWPFFGRISFSIWVVVVWNQVLLSKFADFENFSAFKPAPQHEKFLNAVFDQVIAWGGALKALREKPLV